MSTNAIAYELVPTIAALVMSAGGARADSTTFSMRPTESRWQLVLRNGLSSLSVDAVRFTLTGECAPVQPAEKVHVHDVTVTGPPHRRCHALSRSRPRGWTTYPRGRRVRPRAGRLRNTTGRPSSALVTTSQPKGLTSEPGRDTGNGSVGQRIMCNFAQVALPSSAGDE